MTLFNILVLYVAFRIKHFICDFLLQTSFMALNKGKFSKQGYKALFSHTLIHALGTLTVILLFAPNYWWLAPLDFVIHSVIDRLKAALVDKMGWTTSDSKFWWAFGLDQEAHNFTHLIYIVIIVLGYSLT